MNNNISDGKAKDKLLLVASILLILSLLVITFYGTITGLLTFNNEITHSILIDKNYTTNSIEKLDINGSITSIKLNGKYYGTFSIWINNSGEMLLLAESTDYKNMLTGHVIEEDNAENTKDNNNNDSTNVNNTIIEIIQENITNSPIENLTENITTNITLNETTIVNETILISETINITTATSTTSEIVEFNETTINNTNIIINISENITIKNNNTENTTTPIIEEISTTNPTTTTIENNNTTIENITNHTIEEIINTINETNITEIIELQKNYQTLNLVCVDTCLINKNITSAELIIEVYENSSVEISNIEYTTPKISSAPIQTKLIENIITNNSTIIIDLSEYFTDTDNDEILFDSSSTEGLLYTIDKNIITYNTLQNGTYTTYIYATDGQNTITSNTFTIIFNASIENETLNISEYIITNNSKIVIGEPVKWTKIIPQELLNNTEIIVDIHTENTNLTITYDDTEYDLEKTTKTFKENTKKNNKKITIQKENNTINPTLTLEEQTENSKIKIKDITNKTVTIEYYTEAPQLTEEKTTTNTKKVTVSSNTHYTNVTAYTQLPTEIKEYRNVILRWKIQNDSINNTELTTEEITEIETKGFVYKNIPFTLLDTNSDSQYDKIEWIAEHLSNQTFEIIIITDAEHLDTNKEFISNIYNEVITQDGVWSEEINSNEYVRIKFEHTLDSSKDITIYPRIISGNPRIEVYEINGTNIIAEFTNIQSNTYNKIYLTGLTEFQDSFDLKIIDGTIIFDHIIDPTCNGNICTQLYSTNDSWVVPTGVTNVTVEAWGGGGAGGSTTTVNFGAGGGGGGQYARSIINVSKGQNFTIQVAEITTHSGTAAAWGRNGTNSTFLNGTTALVRAIGGGGGKGTTVTGAVGGLGNLSGSIGQRIYYGGNGGTGSASSGAGGGGAGSNGPGGNASGISSGNGTTEFGGNGAQGAATTGAGTAGNRSGGGGEGGRRNALGGSGAAGYLRINYTINIICQSLTTANEIITLTQNLNYNNTCFNITTANITIDCAGYNITGNNNANSYGIYSNQTNTTIKNCIITNYTNAIRFDNARNGTIFNNTLISETNTLIYLNNTASGNEIYLNNFTNTNGMYVNDTNRTNKYNHTHATLNQGNIYHNIINGSVSITGDISSSKAGLYIGQYNTDYPYNSTTSQGKISTGITDYAPLTNQLYIAPPLPIPTEFVSPTPAHDTTLNRTGTIVRVFANSTKYKNTTYYLYNSTGLVRKSFTSHDDRQTFEATDSISVAQTCALKTNGSIECWGNNNGGQLKNYTGTDAIAVSTRAETEGRQNTCVLKINGSIECWGNNTWGQNKNYTGTDAIAVVTGTNTCALKTNGSIECWGLNTNGQSKNYTGTDAIAITYGGSNTCALKTNGSIECWGLNTDGQSKNYTGTDAIAVSNGLQHTCALKTNGSVECWGNNFYGQAYNYTRTDAIAMSTEEYSTCALKTNGSIECWGYNYYGQATNYTGTDAIGLTVAKYHTCALKTNGSIECWGDNSYGQSRNYTGTDIQKQQIYSFTNLSTRTYYINATSCDSLNSCNSTETRTLNPVLNPVFCSNLSTANQIITLTNDLQYNNTCFNVTAANITIDCNNYNILGNNSANSYGVYSNQSNTTIKNCIITNYSNAIRLDGATNGTIINNIFISETNTLIYLNAIASKNTFCLNNFTNTQELYVNDTNGTNYYNCTYDNKNQGNTYYNVINNSVNIRGILNSSNLGLYLGTTGIGYPYNSTNSINKVSTGVIDYVPLTNNGPPSIVSARISPSNPTDSDTLIGYCNATDIDTVVYYYKWYKNNILTSSGYTSIYNAGIEINVANISNTLTSISDVWILSCLADDGLANSSWSNSSSINIPDTLAINNLYMTPFVPVRSNNLFGYCNSTAAGTNTSAYFFNWSVDGVEKKSGWIYREGSVSAGKDHTCAVLINGSVACWGADNVGQLGDGGTNTAKTSPILINSSWQFASISAGYNHTCGVLVNGSIACWGSDDSGKLGDGGTNTAKTSPVLINSSWRFASVSAGTSHTCAVLINGSVACWGADNVGQLGDGGTDTAKTSPVIVNSNWQFASVSAGGLHTCGALVNGSIACWGSDGAGQLGDGSEILYKPSPVMINSSWQFASISAGDSHTCGVLINGSISCWGDDFGGQLGDGGSGAGTNQYSPILIASSNQFISVASGAYHACGLLINGSISCWGENYDGQLGYWQLITQHYPVMTNSTWQFISITGSYYRSCGVLINGSVACWGNDNYGGIGDGGTNLNQSSPVLINSTQISGMSYYPSFSLVNPKQPYIINKYDIPLPNLYGNYTTSANYVNVSCMVHSESELYNDTRTIGASLIPPTCEALTTIGQTINLIENLTSNTTCLNITVENITIDCRGFSIIGNNSMNTYGIYSTQQNTVIKNCIIINYSSAIRLDGATHGTILNNTLVSSTNNLVYLNNTASENIFCLNNFTNTQGQYINDTNGTNYYNCTYDNKNQGNMWYNAINKSVTIFGFNSSSISGLYLGSYGAGYPYNATNSLNKVSAGVIDYAPLKIGMFDSAQLIIINPNTSNPRNVIANDRISIIFNYLVDGINLSDNVLINNISVGNTRVGIDTLTITNITDFEGVTFPPVNWTTGGDANWLRSTTTPIYGAASAKAGATLDNGGSWLKTDNIEYLNDGTLNFSWKVSSESGFDFLIYCLDKSYGDSGCTKDAADERISGTVSTTSISKNITAGTHFFTWAYAKDVNGLGGSDTGWIDNLTVKYNYTTITYSLVYIPNQGWQLNLTTPNLTGYQNLTINANYNEYIVQDLEPNALNFAINASCQNITNPGTYLLTTNLSSTGTCFNVTTQNVTIDCQGFNITGNNSANTYGIVSNKFNTTIRNCNIANYSTGILFNNANNGTIQNTNVSTIFTPSGFSGSSIYLSNTTYARLDTIITNSTAGVGMYINTNSFNNTFTNINVFGNHSGMYIQSNSSNNTLTNITTTANYGNGIVITATANNNILKNIISASTSGKSVHIFNSANNIITNLTTTSDSSYAIFYNSTSRNNTITNFTAISNTGTTIAIDLNSNNNTLLNGTLISTNNAGILLSLNADSSGNKFALNNFTNTQGLYVNDLNTSNYYNFTIDGLNQGNIWYNVINGSVSITGLENSSITGLYIGNISTGYPYNSSNSLNKVSNGVIDYAPLTSQTNSISIVCGQQLTISNNNYVLTTNLNITDTTCFNITAENITLNCDGYNITGNNASNTYGVYSNQFNTTIKNCVISNFTNAIRLVGATNNSIINNTFIPDTKLGNTLVYINESSSTNIFYWNNFTNTSGLYVNDLNTSNYYNFTIDGKNQGNIWYDIINELVNISGNEISSIADLYLGTYGTSYPYNSTNSLNKVTVGVIDYAPLTRQIYIPPLACGQQLSVANHNYILTTDLNITDTTCFNITAENITIDCNRYTITGNNATATYGIFTNQNKTTILNCNINNFSNGIGAINAIHNAIINNTNITTIATALGYNGYGISFNIEGTRHQISNLRINSSKVGMTLNSNDSRLMNITATVTGQGINIYGSNNQLTNITAITTGQGITISTGSNNILTNITGISNESTGIVIQDNINTTLTNSNGTNTVINGMGISISNSKDILLTKITGTGINTGIQIGSSPNTTLINSNGTSKSTSYGIYLDYSSNSTITNSSAIGTGALYNTNSDNSIITRLTAQANGSNYAIYMSNNRNSTLSDSTVRCINAGCSALYIINSYNNTITNVNGTSISSYGIFSRYNANITITNSNGISASGPAVQIMDTNHSTFTNITAISNTGSAIVMQYGLSNILRNITGTGGTGVSYGIYLYYTNNYTLINAIGIALGTNPGISTDRLSNSTLINVSGRSNNGVGIYLQTSTNNIISNSTGTSNNSYGMQINLNSNNNTFNNIIARNMISGTSGYGLLISSTSNNNRITNITASSIQASAINISSGQNISIDCIGQSIIGTNYSAKYGIYISTFNTTIKNCIISNFTNAIRLEGATKATIINNTLIPDRALGNILVHLSANSYNNTFYWNNFTNTSGLYINSTNVSNSYNFTIDGKNQGNIYYNVITGNVSITGVISSSITGLYVGNASTGYPYNSSNSLNKVSTVVTDYAPLTSYTPPLICGQLSIANAINNLTTDISINDSTCFNITAENITINCNGYTILGNNSANIYGIYSNQTNTTIKNCVITNYTNAIRFDGAKNGTILNNTFISETDTLIYLNNTASGNKIYLNNFTNTQGLYVNDLNTSNYYNFTIDGLNQGNIWYNVINGSVSITGLENSSMIGLYIGNTSTGYPYNSSNSLNKVSNGVIDYAPLTLIMTGSINTQPIINTSRISPVVARVYEDLVGYCNATDAELSNITYYYQWYRNGIANISGVTSTNYTPGLEINVANISSSNLSKNDIWILSCLANDGTTNSTWMNSSNVTVHDPFSATWNTSKVGSAPNTIVLPITGTYFVEWGDGFSNTSVNTHVYGTPGIYTINISNIAITGFRFNNGGDKLKIININRWGDLRVGDSGNYFHGCTNLNSTATDNLDLTGTTDLSSMFYTAINFNGNINGWNTENITNMQQMFLGATNFNQPIGNWNTGKVTNMASMFIAATNFNQPIGNWNTGNVTNMNQMFYQATNFNQNIGNWSTRNVTDMGSMFYEATAFNQNLTGWNTGKVTVMSGMFQLATSFNGNITGWNTSAAITMNSMFAGTIFNQNINGWNTTNVVSMSNTFGGATAFNQNLTNWDTRKVTTMSSMFNGATNFNGNISSWNTSAVTDMQYMLAGTSAFNQNIGNWNTSNVTNMNRMFYQASAFNQNISNWNTEKVININSMFEQATAFNQNLGSWNVSNVTTATNMFSSVTLSTANYDALLTGWGSRLEKNNTLFSGGNSQYTNCSGGTIGGVLGRNNLTGIYNWTISDGGGTTVGCPSITAPVMSTVRISPNVAYTYDTLIGYCNATDSNSDNVSYNYTWYRNGVANISGTTLFNYTSGIEINVANISSSLTTAYENWTLDCLASDGTESSGWKNTSINISNSLPSFYTVSEDANTLLIDHLESLLGTRANEANSTGISYTEGKYMNAVLINSTDTLTYPTNNNLNITIGTIEMWVKPNWNGNDGVRHYFFDEKGTGIKQNRIQILKDNQNYLVCRVDESPSKKLEAKILVNSWTSNEWHHIACSWNESSGIKLYMDGNLVSEINNTFTLTATETNMHIGTDYAGGLTANSIIDELRISNITRTIFNTKGLISPTNRQQLNSNKTNFTWSQAIDLDGDTITYNLIIGNNSDVTIIELNKTELTDKNYSMTINDELSDGTYYWKIIPIDSVQGYRSNETWTFAFDQQPPTILNTTYAPNPAYNNNNIIFQALIDASDRIWYGGNWENGTWKNYTTGILNNSQNYNITISSTNFTNQEIIQFRFYANNTFGEIQEGELIELQIQNRISTKPSLIFPSNASIILTNYTLLNWTNVTDQDEDNITFIVYANTDITNVTDSDNSSIIYTGTQLYYNWSNLTIGEIYYWKVEAYDGYDYNESNIYELTTLNNTPPTIINIQTLSAQDPIEGATKYITLNFTVIDTQGADTLNHSTAIISFNNGAVTRTGTCTNNIIDTTATYNCTIGMKYYDLAGIWNINATIEDNTQLIATNTSTTFTYNTLYAIALNTNNLNFGTLNAGDENKTTNALILNNTGNHNYTTIQLKAYDLTNASDSISVANFKANTTNNSIGNNLINNTYVNITTATLPRSTDTTVGNQSIYVYTNIPQGTAAKTYKSVIEWIISLS